MSENTDRSDRREINEILSRLDAIEARLPPPPKEFVISDYGEAATPTEPPRDP